MIVQQGGGIEIKEGEKGPLIYEHLLPFGCLNTFETYSGAWHIVN